MANSYIKYIYKRRYKMTGTRRRPNYNFRTNIRLNFYLLKWAQLCKNDLKQ